MKSGRDFCILLFAFFAVACDPWYAMEPPCVCNYIVINDSDNTIYVWSGLPHITLLNSNSISDFGYFELFPGESVGFISKNQHSQDHFHSGLGEGCDGHEPIGIFFEIIKDDVYCVDYFFRDKDQEGSFFNEKNWQKREWVDPDDERIHHHEWTIRLVEDLGLFSENTSEQ